MHYKDDLEKELARALCEGLKDPGLGWAAIDELAVKLAKQARNWHKKQKAK